MGLYPVQLTLECCKVLDPNYYFDINTQTCRWAKPQDTCGFSEPINLIVNPKGNDGTLFFIDEFEKETCDLKISFDYLLKIKCEDLLNITNPTVTTNIQSQETIDQIVKTEMAISEVNVKIETLTNQILILNEQYVNTPYSLGCDHFPVTTYTPDPINCVYTWSNWSTCVNNSQTRTISISTPAQNGGTACPTSPQTQACTVATAPCVVPPNLITKGFINLHNGINFTGSQSLACAAAQFSDNTFQAIVLWIVNFAVNSTVYASTTKCGGVPDGYYITNQNTKEITHIVNNVIVSISNPCTTTTATAKVAAFDKSSFSVPATDSVLLDATVYQKGSTTTYITVNYCLTDLGLQTWQTILGPTKYQQFILGNPDSYTCNDVITLSNQPNAAQLFYSCDTPFGTKSKILVQINNAMSELTYLNNLLTDYQNTLIKLQNTFETIISGSKGCQTSIEALEALDVEMHLDVINADNTLTSVFTYPIFPAINSTTNLYNYLTNNTSSGFYICGDPSKDNVGLSNCTTLSLDENLAPNVDSCHSIVDDLVSALIRESGNPTNTVAYNAFASPWKTYTHVISNVTNPDIIAAITNKKIKISFRVKFSCVDFCLLLDNLVLDKTCKSVDRHDITISQNPGFDLKRIIDNKKSWIDTTVPTNREFLIAKNNGNNPIRQTDYNVNDERLVINSKEIDLDISVASAIETDVWCYLNDNPNLLTGYTSTSCTSCQSYNVDFHSLVTQPISAVTTIEQFENLMISELVDAKNRQTITSYPTLRAVYDRYLHSSDYCGTVSSAFDYQNMDKFAGLIGSYWVDLIEQVVPSTTIWGSVKIYTNTIFDEQKFKYKSYSSLLCNNPFLGQQVLSPINGVSGLCQSVNVIYSDLLGGKKLIIDNLITTNLVGEQIMALPKLGSATAENTNNTIFGSKPRVNICDKLCIAQMNSGSEFISYVQVNTLTCNFDGNLKYDTKTLTPITIGGTLPFSYLWSNGATTPTINTTTPGNYTVTVTDANKCSFTAQYEILGQKACWFTMPETPEYVMGSFYQDLYGICDLNDYPLKEVIFNVWEITINNQPITLPAPPLSTTMTPNTINWVAATNSLVYKCVPGQITGQTYTNYVDFLNSVFNSLGLTGYKAQVSLKAQKVGDTHYHDHNGFYILYPATDSFSIKTESVNNTDKYIYSNTGMFEWNPLYEGYNPWGGYGKSFCDGITVTNGKVIE
jgi:hypothetical protein